MSVRSEIKSYYVFHIAEYRTKGLEAWISCYSDEQGNRLIGTLNFYDNSVSIPANSENKLHFRVSQFDGIVQTLRVERPVTFFFHDASYCGIYTGKEPVGEEESRGA